MISASVRIVKKAINFCYLFILISVIISVSAAAMELTPDEAVPCFKVIPRAKSGKVELVWTHLGGQVIYNIHRAQESAPGLFSKTGSTTSTYSIYVDYPVANEMSYLYIVEAVKQDSTCYSNVVSAHPTALRSVTNYVPVIYSSPVTSGATGTLYNYNADATDPNKNILSYSLSSAPQGMTINALTGLIGWSPSEAGSFNVTVDVNDGKGGTAAQSFAIVVQYIGECNNGATRSCSTICGA